MGKKFERGRKGEMENGGITERKIGGSGRNWKR